MLRYALLRIALAIVVLWLVATATFFLVRAAPGGPFDRDRRLPPEVEANLARHWGLDRPLLAQYASAMGHMAVLDFGPSITAGAHVAVTDLVAASLPVSLELGLYAILFALVLGVGAGLVGALRPGSLVDGGVTALSVVGVAVPSIVLAPLLLVAFGVTLRWVPLSGWDSASAKLLPSVSLGLVYAATIARLTRTGLEDVLRRDFVRTARAKGLPEHLVIRRHVLRGGLLPLLAYLGPALASVLTGSVVVERIFGVPGIAEHFVESAHTRDYPMVLAIVMLYSALLVALNLLVDLTHAALDPRVRHG